jgi:septal ring factor EnvC (AmiA/AmiB activator)
MAVTETLVNSYKSPTGKLFRFFEKSRDGWKAKCKELNANLKKEQNQVRAVEKSRAKCRSKAESASKRIRELEHQLAGLKK